MNTSHQEFSLPKEIKKEWEISLCLFVKENSEIYLLRGKSREDTGILKVIPQNHFSIKKFKKQQGIKDETLLLPQKQIYHSGFHYILYQKLTSLKEILCQDGLTLEELLTLGIDLTRAGESLLNSHFYDSDISPNNIYQREDGHFCLGDLSLGRKETEGTPGYMAPEHSSKKFPFKTKKSSSISFDRELQYSICQLLDTIFQLDTTTQNINQKKAILELIHQGKQNLPDSRFSSLRELRKALEKQSQSIKADNPFFLFQVSEVSHPMFQVKTLPMEKKSSSLFFFFWGALILAGCVFLTVVYRQTHSSPPPSLPDKRAWTNTAESTTEGTISFSSPDHASSTPSTTPQTRAEEKEQEKWQEMDIQKKGFTSLESILNQEENPEKISCLYAGDNQLTDISSIDQFPNLRELYLNQNKIQMLPEINTLKHLEILVLSYNQLKKLPDLSKLSSLTYLDLSSNPDFHDIHSLMDLTQLTTLNIAGTSISKEQYQTLTRQLTECNIIY